MTEENRNMNITELKRIIKDFERAKHKYMQLPEGVEKQKGYAYVVYVIESTFDTLVLNEGYRFVENYCKNEGIKKSDLYLALSLPETFEYEAYKILNKLLIQ